MKTLGILETGKPGRSLASFGDYPGMFRTLLGEDRYAYETFTVCDGQWPASAEACEAWLVTGSSAGVYDPESWIEPLLTFIREVKGRIPLVGVCFGHQAMAQALGGQVIKSPKGWGVGLHNYAMAARAPWMDGAGTVAVPAWHQDQVVELPAGATVAGGNDFCPYGFLDYGDAISIQLHPEFDPAYAQAGLRRDRFGLPAKATEAAVRSLDAPNDNARVGAWIRRFLDER